jgi:hypothetical protein
VKAAINVGRWALWLRNSNLLHPIAIPLNKPHIEGDRHKLDIGFHNVEKTFLNLTKEDRQRMRSFYEETKEVPYLEKMVECGPLVAIQIGSNSS